MRILRSLGGTQSLLVQSREANFAKRRSVGSEFVGDDYLRNEVLTSKQFPQQPQRRGLVALGLDQDFENLAFAVDCAHTYICRPAIETIISSRCHRIDSLLTISPRSAKRSSTCRARINFKDRSDPA